MATRETKEQFIVRRTAEIAAELRDDPRFADRGEVVNMVAGYQAECDWSRTRVYASPVQAEQGRIWVGDGQQDGTVLRFNPDGPMVSVMNLTYAEADELRKALTEHLASVGYTA